MKQFSAAILGDDAQIEAAQLNLSFCYITSPFDGRIGLRNVDPGNIVHSAEATPIISVTQIQPIPSPSRCRRTTCPQSCRPWRSSQLDVVVYASDNTTELDRGVLLTPDNTIDTTTGTIKLKATFANAHHTLWPGQFVNAGLLLGTETNVIAVAAPAVQHGPNGLYVYQVGTEQHGVGPADQVDAAGGRLICRLLRSRRAVRWSSRPVNPDCRPAPMSLCGKPRPRPGCLNQVRQLVTTKGGEPAL